MKRTRTSPTPTTHAKKPAIKSASAKIPAQVYADAVVKGLAPYETIWRKHAYPTSMPEFIAEQAKNGSLMAEQMLAMVKDGSWPTLDDCIPEGSILDVVDKFFFQATDLPRELPFYTVLHYVTSLMLQQGVRIKKSETQTIYPDIWTIVLAGSGGGKSMTINAIASAMGGGVKMFPHASSYAKFFDNLVDSNRSFFLKDEFAKFIHAINRDPKMGGMQGCMLDIYSNAEIFKSTMADSISIKNPALSILGLTQIANITQTISKSMMDDGFAQRFGYCFAEKDDRPRVLDYVFDGLRSQVEPLWKKLTAQPFHAVYLLDDVVSKTFHSGGNIIIDRGDATGITEDFSRRVLFRAFKYALAYHVLTGKTDNYLHAEDMTRALRLCARELRDTGRLLDMFGLLTPAQSTMANAAGNSAVSASSPINRRRSTKGQPLTYQDYVAKARQKILDFAAMGKKTDARLLGGYVKVESETLRKILGELAQEPELALHITLPNQK